MLECGHTNKVIQSTVHFYLLTYYLLKEGLLIEVYIKAFLNRYVDKNTLQRRRFFSDCLFIEYHFCTIKNINLSE